MATIEQCRAAIGGLADSLNRVDADHRRKHLPDRTLELHLLDLDSTFRGRLSDGELLDVEENVDGPKVNIRLTMQSDDLVDLTEGRLKFAHAWATGRVRLDAGFRDLLRLRSML